MKNALCALMLCLFMLCLTAGELARADGGWSDTYRIGAGDTLRINVFDENDLSGSFTVVPDGTITMPLIGAQKLVGHTIEQAAAKLSAALKNGYLRNPVVTITVTGYRPFYIMGAVPTPGEYQYRDGLTALQAVAMAGGVAQGGSENALEITRMCGGVEMTQSVSGSAPVLPGDVVRVNVPESGEAPPSAERRYRYD